MNEKRYFTNHGYYINDSFHDGRKWLVNVVDAQEIVDEMNNLDTKARERSKALSKLRKKYDEQQAIINKLREENKKLKEINKDKEQDVLHLYKKNEKLKEIIKKGVNNE